MSDAAFVGGTRFVLMQMTMIGLVTASQVVAEAFERAPGPMSAALPEPLDAGSFCPAGFVGFGLANRRDAGWLPSFRAE